MANRPVPRPNPSMTGPFHMLRVSRVLSTMAPHPTKNILHAGDCLSRGSYLQSLTSEKVVGNVSIPHYQLILQNDGNLVLYFKGKPKWASNTRGGAYACMQEDGNFVIYNSEHHPIFATGTNHRGSHLVLQGDGNLVIYTSTGKPVWASKDNKGGGLFSVRNVFLAGAAMALSGGLAPVPVLGESGNFADGQLQPMDQGELHQEMGTRPSAGFGADSAPGGTTLMPGQKLTSPNGVYDAVFQTDGNFVVYHSGGIVKWASGTDNKGATALAMQSDGNLVVYNQGNPLWASGTMSAGSTVHMQDDGNLVIYDANNNPLWASDGNQGGGFLGIHVNIMDSIKGLIPQQAQGAFNIATKAISQGISADQILHQAQALAPAQKQGATVAVALAKAHTSGLGAGMKSFGPDWSHMKLSGHMLMNGALLLPPGSRADVVSITTGHPDARAGAVVAINKAAAKKSWWIAIKQWLGFKVT